MKKNRLTVYLAAALVALACPAFGQDSTAAKPIDFGTFEPSEDGTFVEVKVSKGLINMAAKITEESEPELAKVIRGLKSIRVNVLEFDEDDADNIRSRVQSIRSQLEEAKWEQVVKVKEGDEDVGIYVQLQEEESIEGLVVTVISGGEAVLVHVDGKLRPEELARVGERLGLPPLEEVGKMLN